MVLIFMAFVEMWLMALDLDLKPSVACCLEQHLPSQFHHRHFLSDVLWDGPL